MSQIIHTNLEIDDWFKQLKNDIDLWITDPPYPFDSQNGTNRYDGMYARLDWNSLKNIFKRMYNATSDGGRAYVFCNRDGIFETRERLEKAGWTFRNLLVWDKKHFGGGYHWRNQIEYIIYVTKKKPSVYIKGAPNLFRYKKPTAKNSIPSIGYSVTGTSCKPYQIWQDILTHGGIDGDVAADPFAGSNPLKAAIELDKKLAAKISKIHTNTYTT